MFEQLQCKPSPVVYVTEGAPLPGTIVIVDPNGADVLGDESGNLVGGL